MPKSKIVGRQKGLGYLVLKRGTRKRVGFEIELLDDLSIGGGIIWGEEEHLKAAAKDGCATLELSIEVTAAIAIDDYKDGEATFTTLFISSKPPVLSASPGLTPNLANDGSTSLDTVTWQTAIMDEYPYVCVIFNEGQPQLLTAEDARELAAGLIQAAKIIETRKQSAH